MSADGSISNAALEVNGLTFLFRFGYHNVEDGPEVGGSGRWTHGSEGKL